MNRRRAKIVCTIGPATRGADMIERLVVAGMDVARLNFSHGIHAERAETIAALRAAAERHDRPLAILQDLGGPKVRIGPMADNVVTLERGGSFTLTTRDVPGDARAVSVTYKDLPRDVGRGDPLLLNDGAIELEVREVSGTDIRCTVVIGGELPQRKGINLPSRSVRAQFFTAKDRADLAFGLEQGVDCVALSFVRDAADVAQVRACMAEGGHRVPLLAKIEKHEALQNIAAILEVADGIMVARGDLGVEIPLERVPRVQKELILAANRAAKPVITATQMLKSMVDNPRPTRAEVTDVANAILDGTDALMLSEETAVGADPVESVEMMSRTACETEAVLEPRYALAADGCDASQAAVAESAVRLADRLQVAALVTCTQSGSTTRLVARHRPRTPIVAATPDDSTRRRLSLVWGALPLAILAADSAEDMEQAALAAAKQAGCVKAGDTVVITAGVPLHVSGTTNTVKLATVP